jgi:hypothetical protein
MITAIIVIATVVFAAIFTIAWLANPGLRRQIEHPKHCFQDQVKQYDRRYDRQLHDAREDIDGGSDESR